MSNNVITIQDTTIDLDKLKIKFTPNEQQIEALNKLANWFNKPDELAFTLMGYAGTGKSSIMKIFIEFMRKKYESLAISITAPTHRAKKVIEALSSQPATTLHSLLGLFPDLDLENLDMHNLKFDKKSLAILPSKGLLIVDESSMINDTLYEVLITKCTEVKCKVLFIGDPAQLKPVKQSDISQVFHLPEENKYELTKVERQNTDNPLGPVLDDIRIDMKSDDDLFKRDSLLVNGKGIEFVHTVDDFLETAKSQFLSQDFVNDKTYTRILTYTNARVKVYNLLMRESLGFSDKEYQKGELLMAYDNFTSTDGLNECELVNSCDYEIIKCSKDSSYFDEIYVSGYHLILKDVSTQRQHTVFILSRDTPSSTREELGEKIEGLRLDAITGNGLDSRKMLWRRYYMLYNAFIAPFDIQYQKRTVKRRSIDYGYAHSIHKSQGGTYTNILVDERDINTCRDREQRNQLKYVALSRPTDKATLLINSQEEELPEED